jgi:hypothetical protein
MVMYLEETEARNDFTDEGQRQLNGPTDISQSRESLQADQSESEAVVRQAPLVEAWETEEPPLCSDAELVETVADL